MMNRNITGILCSMLLANACLAEAKPLPDAYSSKEGKSLRRFLQTWDNDPSKNTRYVAAFEDLNADGKPEAIVHLVSNAWCTSRNCPTLILIQKDRTWQVVSNIAMTQPPIIVLPGKSAGWNNIGVWLQSESIEGHEVELRFDGKTYPKNPIIPLAPPLEDDSAGNEVIPLAKGAPPLY
jgi:hypothetical protein